MTEEKVNPQPTLKFFLKNFLIILRMMRSNREKVLNFINTNERLEDPIIPDFEGFGEPMDEGMIYIIFNSEGKSDPKTFDSVYRIFWVTAPDLKYHQLDGFIVSQKFENQHWNRMYDDIEFVNRSIEYYHEEVSTIHIDMNMHGKWEEGYDFTFNDKLNGIEGKIKYTPLNPYGSLVYYNGRTAIAPSAYQKFYDLFGLKTKGSIKINSDIIELDGRGIIEHGIGIFGTSVFVGWNWLNIQFEKGALHVFQHPLRNENGKPTHAGEGALIFNGRWQHILKDDIEIVDKNFDKSKNLEMEIPIEWEVSITNKEKNDFLRIKLVIKSLSNLSWITQVSNDEAHIVTNYLLEAKGTINDEEIIGRGTMELLDIELSNS